MSPDYNDHLVTAKRMQCNGGIGLLCGGDGKMLKDVRVWQSN